jgi:hypothetical protein
MFGLASSTLALTAILTGAALVVTMAQAGPGFLLYVAMLGEAAAALLPVHVAIALPAGVFGGALLAGSGPREQAERVQPAEVVMLTLVATLLSAWLVGWGMPAGYQATEWASARYVDAPAVEQATLRPAALNLSELLADESAAARAEIFNRLGHVAACLLLGALAAALVASPLSWSHHVALGGTAVAFIWRTGALLALL